MDISHNQQDWLQSSHVEARRGADFAQPDWSVLRARFGAAYAARRAVAEGDVSAAGAGGGSFDASTARCLKAFGIESPIVNRKSSSDVKPGGHISVDVVGNSSTGDRGKK